MQESQIIVLATPVFLLLIALEYFWAKARGRHSYHLGDAVNSLSLGMLSQISALFCGLLRFGLYVLAYRYGAGSQLDRFWTSPPGWLLALIFYDFCYYWLHRAGHELAILWAAHVVHHQSQDYNLTTALRQTSSGVLLGWLFYLPMALAGVPPQVFAVVALIDLLYQFWVHTEQIGKLGVFDRWFCSPSNHRVHHAVNDRYIDRNYGGILMLWDHLFGTFEEESEPCVYGTRSPLESWDPLWANLEVYAGLCRDSWHTSDWRDKLKIWFKPPGWRPPDLAAQSAAPVFSLSQVRRYNPSLDRVAIAFGAVQGLLGLLGTSVLLWYAPHLPGLQLALGALGLCLVLWCGGAVLQARSGVRAMLALEICGLLALGALSVLVAA